MRGATRAPLGRGLRSYKMKTMPRRAPSHAPIGGFWLHLSMEENKQRQRLKADPYGMTNNTTKSTGNG